MISEARKKANQKYINSLDDIKVRVPKGKREIIKQYAERKGLSLNAYINKLIDDDMNQITKE